MTNLLSMQNVTKEGTIKLEGYKQGVRYVVSDDICFYALRDVMRLMKMKGNASNLAAKVSDENKGRHSFGVNMYVVDLAGIFELMAVLGMDKSDALHNLATKVYEDLFTPLEFNYVVESDEFKEHEEHLLQECIGELFRELGRAFWTDDMQSFIDASAKLAELQGDNPEKFAEGNIELAKNRTNLFIQFKVAQTA